MSMNLVIDTSCVPKQMLGQGDTDQGTRALIGLLRARDQAEYVRKSAEKEGRDPATLSVKVVTLTGDGKHSQQMVKLSDLEAEASKLEGISADCATCPVNRSGRPGGCAGVLHYPITRSAEQWLLDRFQMPDTIGGFLMLRAVQDFKYDGAPVKSFRDRRLFESPQALTRPLPKNDFGRTEISTDQFFHALLGVGPKLNPWHLVMVLTWVSGIALDGYLPSTSDQFDLLVNLPTEERTKRTTPNLGEPSADPGERAMQGLLYRMCLTWAFDRPLIIDA